MKIITGCVWIAKRLTPPFRNALLVAAVEEYDGAPYACSWKDEYITNKDIVKKVVVIAADIIL
jgi:hypothetical protein